jgi:hypothetical protein
MTNTAVVTLGRGKDDRKQNLFVRLLLPTEYSQRARLFLQSSELGPPPPHPQEKVLKANNLFVFFCCKYFYYLVKCNYTKHCSLMDHVMYSKSTRIVCKILITLHKDS